MMYYQLKSLLKGFDMPEKYIKRALYFNFYGIKNRTVAVQNLYRSGTKIVPFSFFLFFLNEVSGKSLKPVFIRFSAVFCVYFIGTDFVP